MFFRVKPAKGYRYLQIARSVRRGKTVRQEIIATLGRLDVLQETSLYFEGHGGESIGQMRRYDPGACVLFLLGPLPQEGT